MIITSTHDQIQKWNAMTGEPIGEPIPHHSPVQKVQFSPDGKMFATASWGISLWDTETGQQIGETFSPQFLIRDMVIHPDGKTMACYVEVKDTNNLEKYYIEKVEIPGFRKLGESIEVKTNSPIIISPDGKKFAYGGLKSEIVLLADWEDSGHPPIPLKHQYRPMGADFSPDSKLLVTSEPSGAIRFWDTETGELSGQIVDFGEGVDAVDFSPDGKTVLAGGREGLSRTINVSDSRLGNNVIRTLGRVRNVSYHPNGKNGSDLCRKSTSTNVGTGKKRILKKNQCHIRIKSIWSL